MADGRGNSGMMMAGDGFDRALDGVLRARVRSAAEPVGLEQRLLARMVLAAGEFARRDGAAAQLFATAERVQARRGHASVWTALCAHAAVIALVLLLVVNHTQGKMLLRPETLTAIETPLPPPVAPKDDRLGGGGGQKGPVPVTAGHLPQLAQEQLLPPKAPPLEKPRLAVEPSVVVQPDLKMPDNRMPDLGVPSSNLQGFSLGNGEGSGVGSGNSNGIGPGLGGNSGGGLMHVGGAVHGPVPVYTPEPEFSEEARRAKFAGNVQVYLWVDEHGEPSHVRVVRGVGMGLDQKAVEAVRLYKFKPAMLHGKPVKVDMYIDVNFQIF